MLVSISPQPDGRQDVQQLPETAESIRLLAPSSGPGPGRRRWPDGERRAELAHDHVAGERRLVQ